MATLPSLLNNCYRPVEKLLLTFVQQIMKLFKVSVGSLYEMFLHSKTIE